MVETKRINFGFLVELYYSHEYTDCRVEPIESGSAWTKSETFFITGSTRKNIEARIKKLLPKSRPPMEYGFCARLAEKASLRKVYYFRGDYIL